MRKNFFQLIVFFFVLSNYQQIAAQQVRNTYRFYNTLSTTEADCAPDLVPVKGLNLECQSSTAPTPGQFITDAMSSGILRPVYHNNLNWGLRYENSQGVISKTYTVQIYLKVTNFNKEWTRVIDFADGQSDNGIYFTNAYTYPPVNERCLNFYPNGNFGICPYFNNSTYYLLTFTRNDATKLIDIYVNDQLFTSYRDTADFYTAKAGKPVHIFRDDPDGYACEDGEANFAFISFANYYSTQTDVSLIFQNLNFITNSADFSVSSYSVCSRTGVSFNYSGNIPSNTNQYSFNWDWDGGKVISGTGSGPYEVEWDSPGAKYIKLTINGGGCNAPIANTKIVMIRPPAYSQIDTSICKGSSFEGYNLSGIYIDTFVAVGGCDSIRKINLNIISMQAPSLGALQNLCPGDSLTLSPGNYEHYLWQDGSKQNTFTVKQPGLYSVTVSDKCTSARTQVQVNEADCYLYFPNAFTPNKDGKNEEFRILTTVPFYRYSLMIFNRYGEKIFETVNPSDGWDGKFKGKNVEPGLYAWKCAYKKTASQPLQLLEGTIILIR